MTALSALPNTDAGEIVTEIRPQSRVAAALAAAGIETRPLGGGSMGRQPFWTERYGVAALPLADAIHERSFMLPNHPRLSLADVDDICDVVLGIAP